jgi:hypothetical protein
VFVPSVWPGISGSHVDIVVLRQSEGNSLQFSILMLEKYSM